MSRLPVILITQLNHLIKSAGGIRPMKPGNLHVQGAKSGGSVSKDEGTSM